MKNTACVLWPMLSCVKLSNTQSQSKILLFIDMWHMGIDISENRATAHTINNLSIVSFKKLKWTPVHHNPMQMIVSCRDKLSCILWTAVVSCVLCQQGNYCKHYDFTRFSLWWVTLTICAMWPIMWKYNVIHKTDVHKILNCRCCRTEPPPQLTCTEHFVKFGHVIFEMWQQTDIWTCFASLPACSEVTE